MDSPGGYRPQTSRDALRNSLPALTIFAGAVVALTIGIIDPRKLFGLGGAILLISAAVGFAARLLIPASQERVRAAHGAFDLVIFDCDGVLVDSEVLSVGVEAKVLTDLGWPLTAPEVARRWMGRNSEDQLSEIAGRLGPEKAQRFDELTTAEVRKEFERSLAPVDGVRRLLDSLDVAEVDYCVASSGSHEKMRLTLGITGLMGRFAGKIFSSSEVEHGKPAPDLFLHAAAKMGSRPERCAVVEDSVYGVLAAQAAGMTVYGYAGGLTDARALSEAGAIVVHEMSDLMGMLAG